MSPLYSLPFDLNLTDRDPEKISVCVANTLIQRIRALAQRSDRECPHRDFTCSPTPPPSLRPLLLLRNKRNAFATVRDMRQRRFSRGEDKNRALSNQGACEGRGGDAKINNRANLEECSFFRSLIAPSNRRIRSNPSRGRFDSASKTRRDRCAREEDERYWTRVLRETTDNLRTCFWLARLRFDPTEAVMLWH